MNNVKRLLTAVLVVVSQQTYGMFFSASEWAYQPSADQLMHAIVASYNPEVGPSINFNEIKAYENQFKSGLEYENNRKKTIEKLARIEEQEAQKETDKSRRAHDRIKQVQKKQKKQQPDKQRKGSYEKHRSSFSKADKARY